MATTSTNIVGSLSAGSGVDIKALAQSLVDAEKTPRVDALQAKIDKSTAKISGYGAVSFSLGEIKSAFEKLKDVSDFSSISSSNTQPSAFGVSADATATTGSYDVTVTTVATAQRSASPAYAASSTSLNNGAAFSLDLSIDGGAAQTISIAAGSDTPAGMVVAINEADLGVTAQLINTGNGYKVVVTGTTGVDQNFTLTPSGLDASTSLSTSEFDTTLQSAVDAAFTVNGLSMTRSSNTITDVVDGVTLNLYTATSGSARVDLSRDTSAIKANIQGLVAAYNDFGDTLDILGDRASEVETYGGALAGESFLYTVRSQVRAMVTATSDSAGDNIQAFRDIGVSFDRYGNMTFDEATFDTAISSHFDEVVTMLTADTEAQSVYATATGGAAGDAAKELDQMLRSTGVLALRTNNANTDIARQEERLTELEDRMQRLLDRYISQFAVMDAIVGSVNSTRTGLTSTFEGMMATYTK
jgi:flagellar hook-associated protein 2